MSSLIGNVARKERRDTAANWTSNNPTPLAGEFCLETDTGNIKIGDGVTAFNLLGYFTRLPLVYDISAADTVIALPAITGLVQIEKYYWTGGDGSNDITFTVAAAETIGGLVASKWNGEGKGNIVLESDGTNWQVVEYNDYLEFSNASDDQRVWKYKDGTEKQVIVATETEATSTAESNVFISAAVAVITRNHTFSSHFSSLALISNAVHNQQWIGTSGNQASTVRTASYYFVSASSKPSTSIVVTHTATGKWQ